jgi:hypothetical protein
MPDAAGAIGLFGGIPAALIFLFWWIRRWAAPRPGSSGRGLVLPSIAV